MGRVHSSPVGKADERGGGNSKVKWYVCMCAVGARVYVRPLATFLQIQMYVDVYLAFLFGGEGERES